MKQLPKFHEIFIPVLETLRDGQIIHHNDLRKKVRDAYYANLPENLLMQQTKSGDPIILNRIGWAKVYLKQAGMLTQPSRAMVQITPKGLDALNQGVLTLKDIKADPDFLAHREKAKAAAENTLGEDESSPQDLIDAGIQAIENQVKSDLLERLSTIDPYYFELVVLQLFRKMGYGEFKETAKSGDYGIDGIINQDELGLDKIYVQVKRYNGHSVRELDIRNFIGAMSGDTQKGIFVTTSTFDSGAIRKANEARHMILLIDGERLVDLMYKYGIGVQVKSTYYIKDIDEDYFA